MKSKEEIEELVLEKFKHRMYNPFFNVAFVEGYMQCQEDMAKKLEMHILLNEHDWSRNPQAQLRDFINSLNKQD